MSSAPVIGQSGIRRCVERSSANLVQSADCRSLSCSLSRQTNCITSRLVIPADFVTESDRKDGANAYKQTTSSLLLAGRTPYYLVGTTAQETAVQANTWQAVCMSINEFCGIAVAATLIVTVAMFIALIIRVNAPKAHH